MLALDHRHQEQREIFDVNKCFSLLLRSDSERLESVLMSEKCCAARPHKGKAHKAYLALDVSILMTIMWFDRQR